MHNVLLFLFVGFCTLTAWARPQIIFDSEIEVTKKSEIYLGDLVRVSSSSADLLQSLETFRVEEEFLTSPMTPQVVRKIYKNLVTANPQIVYGNPRLVLPPKIVVSFAPFFSQEEFKRKLINHSSAQCSPCEVTIERVNIPKTILPGWKIKWEEIKIGPSILVPVYSEHKESNSIASQWISVSLRIKKSAMVSKRQIRMGEKLSSDDFEIKHVDVTHATDEVATKDFWQNTNLAARFIPVGKIILASDLKKEPAAIRGQQVKAFIGNENFEISVSAIAESTGQVGDVIKIKTPETKKILSAIIVEKGVVRIQ